MDTSAIKRDIRTNPSDWLKLYSDFKSSGLSKKDYYAHRLATFCKQTLGYDGICWGLRRFNSILNQVESNACCIKDPYSRFNCRFWDSIYIQYTASKLSLRKFYEAHPDELGCSRATFVSRMRDAARRAQAPAIKTSEVSTGSIAKNESTLPSTSSTQDNIVKVYDIEQDNTSKTSQDTKDLLINPKTSDGFSYQTNLIIELEALGKISFMTSSPERSVATIMGMLKGGVLS